MSTLGWITTLLIGAVLVATWLAGYIRRDWDLYRRVVQTNEDLDESIERWKAEGGWGRCDDEEVWSEQDDLMRPAWRIQEVRDTLKAYANNRTDLQAALARLEQRWHADNMHALALERYMYTRDVFIEPVWKHRRDGGVFKSLHG